MTGEPEEAYRLSLARDIGHSLGRISLGVLFPLLLPFLYSLYNFSALGIGWGHYPYTYVLFGGSLLSAISLILYPVTMTLGRSWLASFCALSGFIPYLFSLYVMLVLGVYRLYLLTSQFRLGLLLAAVLWLFVGYAILYRFRQFTEAVAKAEHFRKQVLPD